jgi:serine/threonine protein kinase
VCFVGSFGAVYLANDNESDLDVAIKVFFPGDEKVYLLFFFILFYYSIRKQWKEILVLGKIKI